jgi:hypothetical protein
VTGLPLPGDGLDELCVGEDATHRDRRD